VGCSVTDAQQLQQQQWQVGTRRYNVTSEHDRLGRGAGVEQVLDGLVQMSVLLEEGASYTGARRFSMHPLIKELGTELRSGQLREACGGAGGAVEVLMVQWMVADEGGPGARLVLHEPRGSQPDIRVWQGVVGEEAANFQEAARLLGAAGDERGCMENEGLVESMLGVGDALRELGCWSLAHELEAAVVGVRTRVLGPEHLDTLRARHNNAKTMWAMGTLPRAREQAEWAVGVHTKVLGPEHPETLATMHSLAVTLMDMGDLQGARQLQEQVVAARTRVLGAEHPDTLGTMKHLAATLRSMGEPSQGRELEEKVLGIETRVLGPEHAESLITMRCLATTMSDMGDLAEAHELFEKVVGLQSRVLGPEHPDTLITMHNLAITLHDMGALPKAQELEEKVARAYTRLLGPEHPDTLEASINVYAMMWEQGDTLEACRLLQGCAATAARVLGADHPVTKDAEDWLASTWQQGNQPRINVRAALRLLFGFASPFLAVALVVCGMRSRRLIKR
jgi:hypothetical protein